MSRDPLSATPEKLLAAFDFAAVMAEQEQAHEAQMRTLLLALLDVLDSFDRFLAPFEGQAAAAGDWPQTSRLIRKQLQAVLQQAGVEPLACLAQLADPQWHEIVAVRPVATGAADLIVEEVRRGYTWRGRLLRRPQVVVAAPAATTHLQN